MMTGSLGRRSAVSGQPGPEALRQSLIPLLDGLSRAFGYSRALVALYDPDHSLLRGSVALNVPDPIAESLAVPLREAEHPLVAALVQGRPIRVDDVRSCAQLGVHDKGLFAEMGIAAFVVAPLRAPSGRVGVLAEPFGASSAQDVGSAGVVVLSKEAPISDGDIEGLLPYANQAGETLASARDVEILRDSSERYAIENEWLWWMINSVADPVVVTDDQNDIIRQNRQAELIFRTQPGDSEGKKNAIRMNNFWFTAALSTASLERGSTDPSRELTLVDPIEGSELVFEVISHAVYHYRLNTTGMVSLLKNVTDLRHAAKELSANVQRLQSADEKIRLERDRLDLVLRSVPNPIIVLDNEDQITQLSEEALRLFQPPGKGRVGQRAGQIAASNYARLASFIAQARLDTTAVRQGELTLKDPESEAPLVMNVTSAQLRDDFGAMVGNVSVLQDLTGLRELERRRVEQQLFESEKLAATGRLAASIAHEINNPLEAIKNALYLLNRESGSDAPPPILAIAMKETERVSRILREMLGFYRPEVNTAPTDVNALIREAEALVEKELRRGGIRIHNDFYPVMPLILGSADQIKQVILNLLLNARDAMPDGGEIRITTRPMQDAGPAFLLSKSVLIQIADTGKGIPEELLPSIFEPFFSTKPAARGTGLGLWVSLGIVQGHGGTINVQSRPGEGTRFAISLPIAGPANDG